MTHIIPVSKMLLGQTRTFLLLAIGSLIGPSGVLADRETTSACCTQLSSLLPSELSYPNSSTYDQSLASYWTQAESHITPTCILSPTTAEDVSLALQSVIVPNSCTFAVRGGGHGSVTGIANIDGGVTIDLRGINNSVLSDDRGTVSIGGGQTIGNVNSLLEKYGLSIPAARASSIGIGGSTLGGGIGFLAPSQGFAANSVVEFEVVLANGSIATASENRNRDLWKALKGGGSNFGIVTNLVFQTHPLGDIWAGGSQYLSPSPATVEATAHALYDFASDPDYDTNAYCFVLYGYNAGEPVLLSQYVYAEPIPDAFPFDKFYAVPGQSIQNTSAVTTLSQLSAQSSAQSPKGYQQITINISFENNFQMLLDTWDMFLTSSPKVDGIKGGTWGLTLEPIMPSMITKPKPEFANILDIQIPPSGLILGILSAQFDLASDYNYMSEVLVQFIDELTAKAESLGVYNQWIDMNHANERQKPFAGYGEKSWEFLRETADKYDPDRIFQTLMPGGFKLF